MFIEFTIVHQVLGYWGVRLLSLESTLSQPNLSLILKINLGMYIKKNVTDQESDSPKHYEKKIHIASKSKTVFWLNEKNWSVIMALSERGTSLWQKKSNF